MARAESIPHAAGGTKLEAARKFKQKVTSTGPYKDYPELRTESHQCYTVCMFGPTSQNKPFIKPAPFMPISTSKFKALQGISKPQSTSAGDVKQAAIFAMRINKHDHLEKNDRWASCFSSCTYRLTCSAKEFFSKCRISISIPPTSFPTATRASSFRIRLP